jgi:hypothetical protein
VRLYYTHLYLTSYDVFCKSLSSPSHTISFLTPESTNQITSNVPNPGHGASTFIIMSVESGVGVACGCLPGCKPLMNRLFPRIFASTSQSSSRPSARALAAGKNISSSNATGESYVMQSLRDGGEGVVIDEKRNQGIGNRDAVKDLGTKDVERALPIAPPPTVVVKQERRMSRLGFSRNRRYGECEGSDGSSEIIILQRGSVDEREWRRRGDGGV